MPPTGGKRYLTSTAVFFNEVVKLGISLTMALYEVSRSAPPTVPATSLLSSLASAVFSGDSWKLVIPACLYTLANSLQYIALSNLQAATFQATYQLKMIVSAIFGLLLLKRSVSPRKWGLLLLLLVGVCLVQMPDGSSDVASLGDEAAQHAFPRSFEEWKAAKSHHGGLHKRSATYEGIEEDLQTANPRMNGAIGLLATVGASVASGLAGIYFEKVLKDSAKMTSLWIRNVQLAVYSVFPALFIGVIFLDGEKISSNGVFAGYNWTVWSSIVVQAVVGLTTSFCIRYAHRDMRNVATATSIIFTTLGSSLFFDMELSSTVSLDLFLLSRRNTHNFPAPVPCWDIWRSCRHLSLRRYRPCSWSGQAPERFSPTAARDRPVRERRQKQHDLTGVAGAERILHQAPHDAVSDRLRRVDVSAYLAGLRGSQYLAHCEQRQLLRQALTRSVI